ncbi:MAG: RloB family protein [Desulfurivibrio sp.]|nr:RloB family protein [Desulfurivibrio sp.]
MALTSRKKRPLDRESKPKPFRDARLIVIATEGRKTEKQYFSLFGNKKCQVHIIPSQDDRSAPKYVIERLREFKKEHQLDKDDELWLMIDVDRWKETQLGMVASQAKGSKFNLAVSNPCFEVWLYLHYSDLNPQPIKAKELKKKLKSLIGGYNSNKLDPQKFVNRIDQAIARAKSLDDNPDERWPSRTGTHVYKVMEKVRG